MLKGVGVWMIMIMGLEELLTNIASLLEKHSARTRRSWRKLHLAADAITNTIVASVLVKQDVDDPSQVQPLLD